MADRQRTTKRAPGSWNEASISAARLHPEVSLQIPWLSPERYRALVHRVGAESGYGSQHDLKRPDTVVVEKQLALDRNATRIRTLLGIVLGVAGLVVFGFELAFLPIQSFGILAILSATFVGAGLAAGGLTIATESRWQSWIVRVRLDPMSTRTRLAATRAHRLKGPLQVTVFSGQVTSSSTSAKSGTFRKLDKNLTEDSHTDLAGEFATRLSGLAALESGTDRLETAERANSVFSANDPNLVPLESESWHPVWYDYPPRIGLIRVAALFIPMMLLIWGPMALILPWNYQQASYVSGGPVSPSLAGEPWSPTGSTPGELTWYTYNTTSGAHVNNVPIEIAVCQSGVTLIAIGPGSCHNPVNGIAGSVAGRVSLSIPNGWHIVTEANSGAVCSQCKSIVSFDSPAMAWGVGMTLAGIAVLVPSVILWVRLRSRVRSSWPE